MKTKVLLAVSSFSGGGAEHVARGNLHGLLGDPDFEAAVMTCRPDTLPSLPGLPVYPAQDFRQSGSFLGKAKSAMGIEENARTLQRCFELFRPDIVHLHDYIPFTPAFLHMLESCKRRYGCRVILTHHTYSYLCTNDMLYTRPRGEICERCLGSYDSHILRLNCADNMTVSAAKYLQKNLFREALRESVDLHIAPSRFLQGLLLRAFPALNVRLVYNPCLASVCQRPPEKTEDVLYFGRISREKGLLWATGHFLREEPERQLRLIGDGPQAASLRALLRGQDRVQFINRFLPTGQLLPFIFRARFFLLPSCWYENSPVSIVEAVNAYAVPIVSALGGMREVCALLGVGHTFEPENGQSLHGALQKARLCYLEDREKLKKNRERLHIFTEAAYWQAVREIYRSL